LFKKVILFLSMLGWALSNSASAAIINQPMTGATAPGWGIGGSACGAVVMRLFCSFILFTVGRTFKKKAVGFSVLVLLAVGVVPAFGDTPVALYQSFAGKINITGTGGTLRTNPDGTDSCSVTNSGSMQLSGLPAGATVRKAYLYWAGSGGDPAGGVPADYNVTFNGTPVTADRTFTANGGSSRYFFGGVKDVTSQVTGNGIYTFADLTVQTADVPGGGPYCSVAVVLSAFSLVVVYDDPAETLHVVNLWEGFQVYYGSSISLTPTNFIVPTPAPTTPLTNRILILTWEGDNGNSAPLNGFSENLTFCSPTPCAGAALTDAYNPVNGQFNSSVDIPPSGPFSGIDTTWGVDIDMYDITNQLPAGASSAQSVYSSGGDRVILMNQTMSIANVLVADLAITKSHVGNFTVGTNGVYTLNITNNGPSAATGTITVTDTLPTGLTYVSASGTGWTCGAVGQTVTCTRAGPLTNGATAPAVTLTASVGAAAYPGITNTATVLNPTFDNVAANNTVSDPTTVISSNLSTSTKTWQDMNGGDQNPGDVIQYSITLIETGGVAASGVSVTDTFPVTLNTLSVATCPLGATCSIAGQTLTVSNASVAANGSATIVVSCAIAGGTSIGTTIDNSAMITNPAGPGATPAAPTITVSQSQIPGNGNKPLYLSSAPNTLSRTQPSGTPATVTIGTGASQTWTQLPVAQGNITIDPSVSNAVPVILQAARSGSAGNISLTVSLQCSSGGTTLSLTQNCAAGFEPATQQCTFNLPLGAPLTCAAGNSWRLTILNNSGTRTLYVHPVSGGNISRAVLPSATVINVNSVQFFNAAYPGGSAIVSAPTGTTVYVRSVVSDPFGSFDITGATVTITDSLGTVRVNGGAMTQVADSGAATKTYQYVYAVPSNGPAGNWNIRVTATEGTEGLVTDYGVAALPVSVPLPSLTVLKSVQTFSDPLNDTTNPKAIPGAVMLYTIIVTNSGSGAVDSNSLAITDPTPANTAMCVSNLCSNPPVTFVCSTTPSCGLTFNYASAVTYSNRPGGVAPFDYTPVPDPATGYDTNVTGVRINPSGILNAAGGGNPSFTVYFRVRVN
jgi:uncharacterized repeat protein (TIGR01451 family)